MKEYIQIYFHEDGGVVINELSAPQMSKWLDDYVRDNEHEEGNILDAFFTSGDGIDSMYVGEDKKYMIIKGRIITPGIVDRVTRLKLE